MPVWQSGNSRFSSKTQDLTGPEEWTRFSVRALVFLSGGVCLKSLICCLPTPWEGHGCPFRHLSAMMVIAMVHRCDNWIGL